MKWQCHLRRPENDRKARIQLPLSSGEVFLSSCILFSVAEKASRIETVPKAKCGDSLEQLSKAVTGDDISLL